MPILGNFTFVTNAHSVISQTLVTLGTSDFEFLDISTDYESKETTIAKYLTRAERAVFDEHPTLALASTTVTVLAGARTVALPADVRGINIEKLFYVLADSPQDDQPIPIITRDGGEARTGYDLNTAQRTVPRFAYLDLDKDTIILAEEVIVETTLRVNYQAKPQTFSSSDLGASSVVYSSVPTEYVDVLELRLAERLAGIFDDTRNEAGENPRKKNISEELALADEMLSKSITQTLSTSDDRFTDKGRPSHPLFKGGTKLNLTVRA